MTFVPFNQDDARERAMIAALNLEQASDRVRHDADGHLDVDCNGRTVRLFFECKSAPENKDFGTGRDTGLQKLQAWAGMHFVFGWFEPRDNQPRRLWYGSPAMMRAWNLREQAYIKSDMALSDLVPGAVNDAVVTAVLGDKDVYSWAELNVLMKNQWNADKNKGRPKNLYAEYADIRRTRKNADNLYSRQAAERAVRDRIRYLLDRGGTVNNRKIGAKYVLENCRELRPPRWAVQLSAAVDEALALEPPG